MAFSDFQSVDQVFRCYLLRVKHDYFFPEVSAKLPSWFLNNMRFLLTMKSVEESEAFLAEGFIYPLLQQAWMPHPALKLWSHRALRYDAVLFGEPDYLLAAIPEGATENSLQRPMVAVMEAQRENFSQGWGQCLAALLACQKINAEEELPGYGIVSTGIFWEFAKLESQTFTKHAASYAISTPHIIYGLLDHLFALCEEAVHSYGGR